MDPNQKGDISFSSQSNWVTSYNFYERIERQRRPGQSLTHDPTRLPTIPSRIPDTPVVGDCIRTLSKRGNVLVYPKSTILTVRVRSTQLQCLEKDFFSSKVRM